MRDAVSQHRGTSCTYRCIQRESASPAKSLCTCVQLTQLVNEYLPGQGILPHTDGPAYFPAVATISLGGHTVLDLYRSKPEGGYDPTPVCSVWQAPRSLLVTLGTAYSDYLHGIAERTHDAGMERVVNLDAVPAGDTARTRRVSLTFRDVERVHRGITLMR